MCGIAGYLSKAGTEAPVGRVLLDMLTGLARRGPDSAGLACFSGSSDGTSVAWVRLPTGADHEAAADTVRDRLTGLAEVRDVERHGDLVRLRLWLDGDRGARDLTRALERPGEDFEVVSVGEHLELVKQVGAPGGLEATFGVAAMRGSHGIGHTRLSTESKVDLSHSQPFWAHGVADLATVHNGHITNYDRLRRIYEQQGVRFFTENDSEVIGIYLADQLSRGNTLDAGARELARRPRRLVHVPRRDAGRDRLRPRPVRAQAAGHGRDRGLRRDRERGDRDPPRARRRRRRPRADGPRLPALEGRRSRRRRRCRLMSVRTADRRRPRSTPAAASIREVNRAIRAALADGCVGRGPKSRRAAQPRRRAPVARPRRVRGERRLLLRRHERRRDRRDPRQRRLGHSPRACCPGR